MAAFKGEVDKLRPSFSNHQSRLDPALKLASTYLFTKQGGARDGVPKVAFVITDGRASSQQAILTLREMGVKVFAVGIGRNADPVALGSLVERPEDVFMINGSNHLAGMVSNLKEQVKKAEYRPPGNEKK